MGANHFSQSVFGASADDVRELVVRWMRAKGFDLQSGEPLCGLDHERERGAILAWKGDRVVLMYDHLEEQARLLFELKKLGAPVLDYWMHDSDIWGYQLWSDGAVVDAFHSNPRYFGGFEDIEGPRDVAALCAAVGVSGMESGITKLQGKRAVFVEEASAQFVRTLGVAPAAAQYGYVQEGTWPKHDFEHEQLWFRRSDWDPMAGWEVDRLRFEVVDPMTAWQDDVSDEDRAAMEAQLKRAQRMGSVLRVLLWPLSLVTRAYFWWKMRSMRAEIERRQEAGEPLVEDLWDHYDIAFEVEGDRLVNPTHGCSMTLPEGASVTDHHRAKIGRGVVFRFEHGEQHVVWSALMPKAAEQMTRFGPADSELVEQTLKAGERTVRWVEVTWDSPAGPDAEPQRMWRLMAFVAGPNAVYQFAASQVAPVDPQFLAACKAAVTSLRFDETGAPTEDE